MKIALSEGRQVVIIFKKIDFSKLREGYFYFFLIELYNNILHNMNPLDFCI